MTIDHDDLAGGADEAFARRIAAPLRTPERLEDSFEARLMARVEAAVAAGEMPRADIPRRDIPRHDIPRHDIPRHDIPRHDIPRGPRGWDRLTSARTLRVSPLAGLAVAAGFAGIVALGTIGFMRGRALPAAAVASASPGAPAATRDTVRIVQFVLVAPQASQVAVVGDFNDWRRGVTPLRRVGEGNLWTVEVPLAPGRHQYAFIVNGTQWVLDPSAPTAVEDDFGTPNSVVTVGEIAS